MPSGSTEQWYFLLNLSLSLFLSLLHFFFFLSVSRSFSLCLSLCLSFSLSCLHLLLSKMYTVDLGIQSHLHLNSGSGISKNFNNWILKQRQNPGWDPNGPSCIYSHKQDCNQVDSPLLSTVSLGDCPDLFFRLLRSVNTPEHSSTSQHQGSIPIFCCMFFYTKNMALSHLFHTWCSSIPEWLLCLIWN